MIQAKANFAEGVGDKAMFSANTAVIHSLMSELSALLKVLGSAGGSMSPSVYETAQVLRLFPPPEGPRAGIEWLLTQQQSDGGWGSSVAPIYRDVPTLAAILALYQHRQSVSVDAAIDAGLAFIDRQSVFWCTSVSDALPVAFELILPQLLADAAAAGLPIAHGASADVVALGKKRRQLIAQINPGCSAPAVFSWEAWGMVPDPQLVDPIGSVGHNPAATAAWLCLAEPCTALNEPRRRAAAYLQDASASTQLGIPGVVPCAWPVTRFEQSFGLHALLLADLLEMDELQDALLPQLEDLHQAITPGGLGMSDWFALDGDDTAAAVAVLGRSGRSTSYTALAPFERATHFSTYPFELQASLTVTARATHALAAAGRDVSAWRASIINAQAGDGWWYGDKWNISPLYITNLALLALRGADHWDAKLASRQALITNQHSDGGWGSGSRSTPEETAHGILALYTLACDGMLDAAGRHALRRSHCFLLDAVVTGKVGNARIWISKDLYRLERVDRVFILCALLAPLVNQNRLRRQRNWIGRRHEQTIKRLASVPGSIPERAVV